MGIVTITLATMAGLGSLLYAVFWQTPTAIALALMTCGALLTATFAWYFRPEQAHRDSRSWHGLSGRRHRHRH